MDNQLLKFFNDNLEELDSQWRSHCFKTQKGREVGDLYHNENRFWMFVEESFKKQSQK